MLLAPSLSLESGRELITLLADCRAGRRRLDVLCVEGALLRGPNGSGRFHLLAGTGVPMIGWVRELAAVATHVVAVGTCAAWGRHQRHRPNVTEACGLQYDGDRPGGLLGAGFVPRGGLPVINAAGCPTHPDWVVDTLMALAAGHAARGTTSTPRRARASTPTSWCTTAARATSTTSSRPAPRSPPTWAA